MGKGIELARQDAPEHAQLMDDLKDQLIIALVRRLGMKVEMAASEIDQTGGLVLLMSIDPETKVFTFELRAKQ